MEKMSRDIIKLENVKKNFNAKEILKDINLKIEKGEKFGIFGPSGCGKTTLLRIISGLERPDYGKVYMRGKEMNSNKTFVPPEKRNISFIFQDLALWPHMTVKQHLEFVMSNRLEKEDVKKGVKEILNIVNLTEHLDSKPEQISGGEKQRVAIARAIAQKSDIFLLDEPLSSLDFSLKEEIKNLLQKLQKKYNLTMIYVTHDIFEILDLCNRVALLKDGEIVKVENPRKLLKEQISTIIKKVDNFS